jgi:hypothetical protein
MREIDKALSRDSELMSLFNDLRSMKKSMDEATLEPSNQTVLNILSYSRSLQPKQS